MIPRNIYLLFLPCIACLLFGLAPIKAEAQSRDLPPAAFQTYARPDGSTPLPQSMGLHLTPGLNRWQNGKAEVYPPGEPSLNGALVRWEAKKMPLHIWISPGLKLPDCPFEAIQQTRVDQVFNMLRQKSPFAGLEQAQMWTPDTNDLVAQGIEEWRPFQDEGLISFGFTDDPLNAQIMVFFTEGFHEGNSPGGIAVGGITSGQVYPLQQALQMNIAQKPVIIELSTMVNSSPERMRGAAAHEFGHALGIKAHSPYREDIMYVDRVVNDLSPSDAATLRWLYHQTPQYVY